MEHPNPVAHWKNRRIHAYAALVWIILQTFLWVALAIKFPLVFPALDSLIGFSYTIPSGVLSAYYVGSSFQDFIDKKR